MLHALREDPQIEIQFPIDSRTNNRVNKQIMSKRKLILSYLSSESEADDDEEAILLCALIEKKFKSPNKYILSERKESGQFKITSKMNDADFTNYFRMNRNQFCEVHGIIQGYIDSNGCNAQKPIATEEKLFFM